jgi:hypothetical protein
VPKTCLASPINQGPEALHGRALSWIAKPNLEGPIPNNVEQNRIYRAFACWCARRAWEYAKCAPCVDVVLAAEAYLRGQWSFETMLALQKKRSSGVADLWSSTLISFCGRADCRVARGGRKSYGGCRPRDPPHDHDRGFAVVNSALKMGTSPCRSRKTSPAIGLPMPFSATQIFTITKSELNPSIWRASWNHG